MKKIILINGLIAGIIVSAMFFISKPLQDKGYLDLDNAVIVGYASMVLAFSMIFISVRSYRDQYLGGSISFGKALVIGLLITVVAGVVYALSWEVYYRYNGEEFMQKYSEHYFKGLEDEGKSAKEIQEAKEEWNNWMGYYKNPLVRFAATLAEIFPVGLLMSFVAAGVMRKKKSDDHSAATT